MVVAAVVLHFDVWGVYVYVFFGFGLKLPGVLAVSMFWFGCGFREGRGSSCSFFPVL